MISTLEIDGVQVPTESILEFDQAYVDLGGFDFRRVASGDGVSRVSWSGKISTTINGKGWAPSAFQNLTIGASHALRCVMPRTATSATTSVVLPAQRRADTDHEPQAFGVVGDSLVATTISNLAAILAGSTNTATVDSVSGAASYRVNYWPEITAVILRNTCTGRSDANYEWQIEAEEI